MIWLVGLGAAALGVWVLARRTGPLDEKIGADGVCRTDPELIAHAHGVSLDVEALARMMATEATGDAVAQVAVGAAAINRARKLRLGLAAMLLRARTKAGARASGDGFFAAEKAGKIDGSTARPSTTETRALARDLLAGKIADPTSGATLWDSPATQDLLVAQRRPGYTKTSAEIAASRSKSADRVLVPGVTRFEFWRPRA